MVNVATEKIKFCGNRSVHGKFFIGEDSILVTVDDEGGVPLGCRAGASDIIHYRLVVAAVVIHTMVLLYK